MGLQVNFVPNTDPFPPDLPADFASSAVYRLEQPAPVPVPVLALELGPGLEPAR